MRTMNRIVITITVTRPGFFISCNWK